MKTHKIVKNIKKLGFLYAVIMLFSIVVQIIYENTYIEIAHVILLFGVWYFFIKNITIFYEDAKMQRQNNISIFYGGIGSLGIFAFDKIVLQNSSDDIGLGALSLFVICFLLFVIGAVYSLILTYKLYKHTKQKAFFYYFLAFFLVFIFLVAEVNTSLSKNYFDIIYGVYYFGISLLFAKGVLEFYTKNCINNDI